MGFVQLWQSLSCTARGLSGGCERLIVNLRKTCKDEMPGKLAFSAAHRHQELLHV